MKTVNQLTVKLNPKGQITIPRQIRQQLGYKVATSWKYV